MKPIIYQVLILSFLFSCQPEDSNKDVQINGDLKQWSKVELSFNGPSTGEWEKENPFLDYRLDVTFSQEGESMVVPGFYAADGNAAESSADEGNVWKVIFRPPTTGEWDYQVSFRKGKDIAVNDEDFSGQSIDFDGMTGSMTIAANNLTTTDFASSGRIINGGQGYMKFAGSGERFIKNGTDSPENFLAYTDFDQTYRYGHRISREGEANTSNPIHGYESHVKDWKEGDPTWQGGKGKAMIGAVNYLAEMGMNSIYMLTMNIQGDGKDVWPYNDHNERYRFDCSKLEQWEIVFDHMEKSGVMMQLVLQETENETLLDNGFTEVQRKLYLRELVARFGHHLGVIWNLGEENGPTDWSPIGQTDQQRKDMAAYLHEINPYDPIIVIHSHSDDHWQDAYLPPLLGFEPLDGVSMQVAVPGRINQRIANWKTRSDTSGQQWIVNMDELGPHWKGILPDEFDVDHDTVRHDALWGALMAGSAGVEWYFGYRFPHTDLDCEDFRSRENWWKQSTIATRFINDFPLEEMESHNELVNKKEALCLAKSGDTYLVYTATLQQPITVDLEGDDTYSIHWFDPKEGGDLQEGSKVEIKGGKSVDIGLPPINHDMDWVVVLRKI